MNNIWTINPSTGKRLTQYRLFSNQEIINVIQCAYQTFLEWRRTSIEERSELLSTLSVRLNEQKEHLAILMANEMGKPIREGKAEVEKCIWVLDYYAENGAKYLEEEILIDQSPGNEGRGFVSYCPMGVIFAIMPWNFPLWQVFRFAASAIMAGNTICLKHASNVSGIARAIEGLFADLPPLIKIIIADSSMVEMVIEHPLIVAVTLTGSTSVGKIVASIAGKELKKCVLELGGSDPFIVFPDADLQLASSLGLKGRLINCGQSCIAAKRFIIFESIVDSFTEMLVEKMKKVVIGNPLIEATEMGPLARFDVRQQLHDQVQNSLAKGGKLLLGGLLGGNISKNVDSEGAFYPPTVLTDIKEGMPAYHQEVFGPVVSIIKVKDIAEAIKVANHTSFGLGAAIFTEDLDLAHNLAIKEIEAGAIFINDFVKSDPRLPFGGIKESGYGRELSYFGMREFVNIKTIKV